MRLTDKQIIESLILRIEDVFIGQIPDHSVVILSCNDDIVCYDPIKGTHPVTVPEERFKDAWKDAEWYMVAVWHYK